MSFLPVLVKIREKTHEKRVRLIFCSIVVLVFVVALVTAILLVTGKLQIPRITSQKELKQNSNPAIQQEDFILRPKSSSEENKTTLYGEITRIKGDIMTVSNKKTVSVEISKEARFYRAVPKKGLEEVTRSDFKPGNALLIGALSPSQVADYKGEIFILSDTPTLVWHTD